MGKKSERTDAHAQARSRPQPPSRWRKRANPWPSCQVGSRAAVSGLPVKLFRAWLSTALKLPCSLPVRDPYWFPPGERRRRGARRL